MADDWRGPRYDRFVANTEIPLLILAVAFIPVLVIPEVATVSAGERRGLHVVDWSIWAVFAAEYLARLFLARHRGQFVRHNVFDLAIVALPMLRPLRIVRSARAVRLLRLARLAALMSASGTRTRRSLHARAVTYVLSVSVALTLLCSVLILDVERRARGANIRSYGDALWWRPRRCRPSGTATATPSRQPGGSWRSSSCLQASACSAW